MPSIILPGDNISGSLLFLVVQWQISNPINQSGVRGCLVHRAAVSFVRSCTSHRYLLCSTSKWCINSGRLYCLPCWITQQGLELIHTPCTYRKSSYIMKLNYSLSRCLYYKLPKQLSTNFGINLLLYRYLLNIMPQNLYSKEECWN